jgi:hypothetical protein
MIGVFVSQLCCGFWVVAGFPACLSGWVGGGSLACAYISLHKRHTKNR